MKNHHLSPRQGGLDMQHSKYQKLMNLGNSLQERRIIKKMIIETGDDAGEKSTPEPEKKGPDKDKAKKALEATKNAFEGTEGLPDSFKKEADEIIDQILDLTPGALAITAKKFIEEKIAMPTATPAPEPGDAPKARSDSEGGDGPKTTDTNPVNATTDAAPGTGTNTMSATDPKADSRFEKWRRGAADQLGKIGKSLGDKFRGSPGSKPQSDDDEPGTAPGNRRRVPAGGAGGRASSEENEAREIIRGREALSFIDEYGLEKMKRLMDDKKIDVRIIIL